MKFGVALLIALLPVIYVQVTRIFALDKDMIYHHTENCKKHKTTGSILDFSYKNSEEYIGIEENLMDLFTKGPAAVKNGKLVRIVDVGYGSPKFIEIEKVGFPKDIDFHPFGIHLEGLYLYVLNHAFGKGGSRIEVFDYMMNKATYHGSIILPDDIGGTFGDLIYHNGYIYLTQYSSIPLPQTSDPMSFFTVLKTFYRDFAQVHMSGVYKCTDIVNTIAECTKLEIPLTSSVTGITKNKDNEVFVSFSSMDYNWIGVFDIGLNGNLNQKQKISLRDRAERLSYDKETDRVYAGAIPWPMMMMTSSYVPGGAVEIKKTRGTNNYFFRRLYMQEKEFMGGSSAARIGNYVISGSFMDSSVYVCLIVDP